MIYFVRNTRSGDVKIGYSADPAKRFQQLQCPCVDRLEMIGAAPGDKMREKQLHRRVDHLHVRGEWYRDHPDLNNLIDSVLRPYPFMSGRVIRSVYLAGRFGEGAWRNQIMPNWSAGSKSLGTSDDCGELCWESRERCVPVPPCHFSSLGSSLDYAGPFFVDLDQGHGGGGYGPHDSAYDRREAIVEHFPGHEYPIAAADVVSNCCEAIDRADLVFAWIDSRECYGTLVEIGCAAAKGKLVIVAAPAFDRELWFAPAIAGALVLAPTPGEAWRRAWNGHRNNYRFETLKDFVPFDTPDYSFERCSECTGGDDPATGMQRFCLLTGFPCDDEIECRSVSAGSEGRHDAD